MQTDSAFAPHHSQIDILGGTAEYRGSHPAPAVSFRLVAFSALALSQVQSKKCQFDCVERSLMSAPKPSAVLADEPDGELVVSVRGGGAVAAN